MKAKRPKLPKLKEVEFLDQVIAFARLHGWRVAHFRPARTASGWRTPCQADAKGFPDLTLARPATACRAGRVVAAELKVGKRGPTDEQKEWLDILSRSGVEAYLWTPENWSEIEATLR